MLDNRVMLYYNNLCKRYHGKNSSGYKGIKYYEKFFQKERQVYFIS